MMTETDHLSRTRRRLEGLLEECDALDAMIHNKGGSFLMYWRESLEVIKQQIKEIENELNGWGPPRDPEECLHTDECGCFD